MWLATLPLISYFPKFKTCSVSVPYNWPNGAQTVDYIDKYEHEAIWESLQTLNTASYCSKTGHSSVHVIKIAEKKINTKKRRWRSRCRSSNIIRRKRIDAIIALILKSPLNYFHSHLRKPFNIYSLTLATLK